MFHDYLSFEQPIAELEAKIDELRLVNSDNRISINEEIDNLLIKSERLTEKVYSNLSNELDVAIDKLLKINTEKRIKNRINKFSKMGIYSD